MKIDVTVCTYQSEKYLDECLTSIEKSVPINRLIIIDHNSTDKTLEIAKKHKAEIHFENVGLGYARQLAINLVETPIFMFVDSDVAFHNYDWFPKAVSLINEEGKVGAVVVHTPDRNPVLKQKYVDFWWKRVPALKRGKVGFHTYSTLILKKAIEGIRIPSIFGAFEHLYILLYMRKLGWTYDVINVEGMHYEQILSVDASKKAMWFGAGHRILGGINPLPHLLIRRILTAPLKALPPAIAEKDPNIISWNTRYWFSYLNGWLHPEKYGKMKR